MRGGTSPLRVMGQTSSLPDLRAVFQSDVPRLGFRSLLLQAGEVCPTPPASRPSSRCHRAAARVPSPRGPGGGPDGASLIQQRRRAAIPARGRGCRRAQGHGASGSPALPCPGARRGSAASAPSSAGLRGALLPPRGRRLGSANKPAAAPRLEQGTPPGALLGELWGCHSRGSRRKSPRTRPGVAALLAAPAPLPGAPPRPFEPPRLLNEPRRELPWRSVNIGLASPRAAPRAAPKNPQRRRLSPTVNRGRGEATAGLRGDKTGKTGGERKRRGA